MKKKKKTGYRDRVKTELQEQREKLLLQKSAIRKIVEEMEKQVYVASPVLEGMSQTEDAKNK